jgi:hypothetical protein
MREKENSVRIICNCLLCIEAMIFMFLTNNPWWVLMVFLGWQYHKNDNKL